MRWIVITAVALSSVGFAQDKPDWLLVRSRAKGLGTFSWERLAKAYRLGNHRIVRAKNANAYRAASRLVAGTPEDNPLVKKLAAKLGIGFEGKRVRYKGKLYPEDSGLALVTDDPDGAGRLVLFAGATPKGALACLSVPVDMGRHGWVAMTWQNALARGKVTSNRPVSVAGDELRIVRLDRVLFDARATIREPDEAALHASRAFAGYRYVFARAVTPDVDLFGFTRELLEKHGAALEATRKRFASVDLRALILEQDEAVTKLLGAREGPRPIIHVIATKSGMTNAQVIGKDPVTGRVRMTLNLAAFSELRSLRVAVTHELVHTLQGQHEGTLASRSVHEGVATFLSQQLCSGTKDHEALMWSPEKLVEARRRQQPILRAFRRLQDSRDMARIGSFLYLGRPLRAVRGAPDRCGYFIGWEAVRAWRKQNSDRPLRELLNVDPSEVLAALK